MEKVMENHGIFCNLKSMNPGLLCTNIHPTLCTGKYPNHLRLDGVSLGMLNRKSNTTFCLSCQRGKHKETSAKQF